jgi:hypothetical protein
MKRLILKSIVFVVLGFLILNMVGYWIISDTNLSKTLSWNLVLSVVKKSKRLDPVNTKVIFVGDSVGNQLFSNHVHPDSLTTTGSVLMAGHYILAHNAIKRIPGLKYVVLVSVPFVIGHAFERSRTYNNFIKPFYTFENLPLISDLLQKKISRKKWVHLAIFPFIKTAPFLSDINCSVGVKENRGKPLSDLSIEYLKKLDLLCREKHITLIVLSPPVMQSRRKKENNWKKMRIQIREAGFSHLFRRYFRSITYLPDSAFKDTVHMNQDFLRKNRQKIISKLLPREVILSMSKR